MRYGLEALKKNLFDIGLREGDLVALACSFKNIGKIEGGPRVLIEAIISIVGPNGGIIAPSYTGAYRFTKVLLGLTPTFDPNLTRSNTGGLAELMIEKFSAVRSRHPSNSMVGIGPKAISILSTHGPDSGAYEPYSLLAKSSGIVLSIGVGDNLVGIRHEAQSISGLLSLVRFNRGVKYVDEKGRRRYFLRTDVGGCTTKLPNLVSELRDIGLLKDGYVGKAQSHIVSAEYALNYMSFKLSNSPYSYLCDCSDCIWCREVEAKLKFVKKIQSCNSSTLLFKFRSIVNRYF